MIDVFSKCAAFTRADELRLAGLYPYFRAIASSADREVMIDGRRMIMIGSNNYLGLTTHPKVQEAAKQAIDKYGSGCTGSRFLNGTLDIHEELEGRLARFMGKPAALLFSTGFQANLGAISALAGKNDIIFCDRMSHASIIDGCRLSLGSTVRFRHNDMKELARLLDDSEDEASKATAGRIVVTEGVFSMEGDVGDLQGLVALKREREAFSPFRIFLDDAHGIGVLGPGGRGAIESFSPDVHDGVDVVMGTFSKSFASLGGFIAGPTKVIDYVKHHARELIFSASMPPSAVATVLAALDVIEQEPERRFRLWRNVHRMAAEYRRMGWNIGGTQSPIIPLIIGDAERTLIFWRRLFDSGIFTNPIVSPAVPQDMCLLRTSYMATHTDEELDRVLETVERVGTELGLIGTRRVTC